METEPNDRATVRVIATPKTWIESEAVAQLERTAALPGMRLAVGLPDLHAGKGHPIGAAFLSQGVIHPRLVGNDIGCGMGLWVTDLPARKLKLDAWTKRLGDLDGPWDGDREAWLADHGAAPCPFDSALGTIGGGNHFAELQAVERVDDAAALAALGLDRKALVLLVHSGSRGLGESILQDYLDGDAAGLPEDGPAAADYLRRHDAALHWAEANRALIAHRFLGPLRAAGTRVLDVNHNTLTRHDGPGAPGWLHRKGATPATEGPVVIPGSRGDMSYLVEPVNAGPDSAWSLAHGAGRKWTRRDARGKLGKTRARDLTRTALGSRVICEDRALMFEEAPQAYKAVDSVVGALEAAGLVRVIAVLRPVITYKTRRGAP
ncbi:MAG: RNA ligase RtcB family protein [Rhodobacterales bacterium]|nr:RNA ligase RtcB family protein [Rhodobacterales bacterium]